MEYVTRYPKTVSVGNEEDKKIEKFSQFLKTISEGNNKSSLWSSKCKKRFINYICATWCNNTKKSDEIICK